MSTSKKSLLLVFIAIGFCATNLVGITIKMTEKIKLSQATVFLEKSLNFCVTEDELFLIPDLKAGDIKIYDNNGDLVKTLGRSGLGPLEFLKPAYCYYDKKGEFGFGVIDFGVKKIFLYKRTGKFDFQRSNEVLCLAVGTGIKVTGNKLLISGWKRAPNGNAYDLYTIDSKNGQASFLIPSYYKYGLKSSNEYEFQYKSRPDIATIGIRSWIDIHGKYIYFCWEGDLRIIKMNIDSGALKYFGEKTPHYLKPNASKRMIEAYKAGNFKLLKSEKAGMSYVKNIFAGPKYVILIYEGPKKEEGESNFWVQFYTLDGKFLKELPLACQPESLFYFEKEKSVLYSLGIEADDELNEENVMLKFKVSN